MCPLRVHPQAIGLNNNKEDLIMNKGLSLTELAQKVETQTASAQDYVAPTSNLDMVIVGEGETSNVALHLENQGFYDIQEQAHNQIASKLQIPTRYYNKMLAQSPELLVENTNHWLAESKTKSMIRTRDGEARAILSDRYRRIDNDTILMASLQAMETQKQAVLLSSEVTDRKMYMKVLFPELEAEIKKGDIVRPGVVISNSEVGAGALNVQGFFYRDYCTNGCVFGRNDIFSYKRTHLGGRLIEGADYKIISDEAIENDNEAMMLSVRDTMGALSDERFLVEMAGKLRQAADTTAMINPERGIEILAREVGLSDKERQQALINLIQDRDYTKWGALNAVTKLANDVPSYDRASELENIGTKILEINPRQWEHIAVPMAA